MVQQSTSSRSGTAVAGDRAAPGGLAEVFGHLARSMEGEAGTEDVVASVVRSATALVPGTEDASVSLLGRGCSIEPHAPSAGLSGRVDTAQAETGQGPGLDAIRLGGTVHVPEVATETRWPDFARRASAAGAGSLLSLQLFVHPDTTLGALTLVAGSPHAFGPDSQRIGLVLSAHAAVAVAGARQRQHLNEGLTSRDVIGQAKGLLMERYGIDADVAFSLLVRVSRSHNRKLRDVCEELVLTRELVGQHRDRSPEPATSRW